ncbi:MAG TPA: amidase [Steroidobacteraceae bacterium]|nr:amidase [Steroidobacteraceae bacterium]
MRRREFVATLGAATAFAPGLIAAAQHTAPESTAADDEVERAAAFDVAEKSLGELQAALTSGEITSASLTLGYFARIERLDRRGPALRAVLAQNPDALTAARALDAERRAGRSRGPLHGIPLLLKDNIESNDPLATTAGSLALAGARHAADAPLVARLRAAGAIVLGKTNLSEWANFRSSHSISGWSAVGGQTRNAYATDRNPSGSSSGSAVATAASLCAAAIGSETDGSILAPSSVNGLVGLKPTVGLVSGRGIVPLSPRQDTAGPIARSVTDAALLLAVLAERPLDATVSPHDLDSFSARGLRVGVVPATNAHPVVARESAAWPKALEEAGATLVPIELPKGLGDFGDRESEVLLYDFKAAISAYLEGLHGLVPYRSLRDLIAFNDAHASEELVYFGQELFEDADKRGGLDTPAYIKTLEELTALTDTAGLALVFRDHSVDVLMVPCNGPAEALDLIWGDRSDASGGWPSIASAAAVGGYPSMTVPATRVSGLPVGAAFVAPRWREALLLKVGRVFERALAARRAPSYPA